MIGIRVGIDTLIDNSESTQIRWVGPALCRSNALSRKALTEVLARRTELRSKGSDVRVKSGTSANAGATILGKVPRYVGIHFWFDECALVDQRLPQSAWSIVPLGSRRRWPELSCGIRPTMRCRNTTVRGRLHAQDVVVGAQRRNRHLTEAH